MAPAAPLFRQTVNTVSSVPSLQYLSFRDCLLNTLGRLLGRLAPPFLIASAIKQRRSKSPKKSLKSLAVIMIILTSGNLAAPLASGGATFPKVEVNGAG